MADSCSIFHTMQLNPHVCYLPVPVTQEKRGNKCCAMCRWATGKNYTAHVSSCEGCNVVLCVWCFKSFHTVKDLEARRDMICLEIVARKNSWGLSSSGFNSWWYVLSIFLLIKDGYWSSLVDKLQDCVISKKTFCGIILINFHTTHIRIVGRILHMLFRHIGSNPFLGSFVGFFSIDKTLLSEHHCLY